MSNAHTFFNLLALSLWGIAMFGFALYGLILWPVVGKLPKNTTLRTWYPIVILFAVPLANIPIALYILMYSLPKSIDLLSSEEKKLRAGTNIMRWLGLFISAAVGFMTSSFYKHQMHNLSMKDVWLTFQSDKVIVPAIFLLVCMILYYYYAKRGVAYVSTGSAD